VARARQPTHVRTGSILHLPRVSSWRSDESEGAILRASRGRRQAVLRTSREISTRSLRSLAQSRVAAHQRGCAALIRYDSRMLSGWMSIFAPVSLAARRAFWPSFPIASDSW